MTMTRRLRLGVTGWIVKSGGCVNGRRIGGWILAVKHRVEVTYNAAHRTIAGNVDFTEGTRASKYWHRMTNSPNVARVTHYDTRGKIVQDWTAETQEESDTGVPF